MILKLLCILRRAFGLHSPKPFVFQPQNSLLTDDGLGSDDNIELKVTPRSVDQSHQGKPILCWQLHCCIRVNNHEALENKSTQDDMQSLDIETLRLTHLALSGLPRKETRDEIQRLSHKISRTSLEADGFCVHLAPNAYEAIEQHIQLVHLTELGCQR